MYKGAVKVAEPIANPPPQPSIFGIKPIATGLTLIATLALTACGGGSGGGGGGNGNPGGNNVQPAIWTPGVFAPSSDFAAQCAVPRSGTDPDGNPYPDVQGNVLDENNYLRSWSDNLYLWYSEIADRDPALYSTTEEYFDLLKTEARTPSGNLKDQFHFTYPTDVWEALSQSGESAGYGMELILEQNPGSRIATLAFTEPNSPSTAAGVNLARGARITEVDGVSINVNTQAGVDSLNAGLFPSQSGESHEFTVQDLGAGATRTVTMISAIITSTPVQSVFATTSTSGVQTGYVVFNAHIATAEQGLINAVNQLASANIDDLVLDLRYNSGGFLAIASQMGYMIAGSQAVGQTFESLVFNDKHQINNPVTGQALSPVPFLTETLGLSASAGQALPTLDLNRVFVLTSADTCSASEAIMNGLRGIGLEVIQIGSSTCGKPYGFYPQDNCGTTYFTVQFRGENAQGFGDYPDGFSPSNGSGGGESVTGCAVADDLSHALGDIDESMLAAALNYDLVGCPTVSGSGFSKDDGLTQQKNGDSQAEMIPLNDHGLNDSIMLP